MGVLAAYVHRRKTGEGQLVDTSLFEAGIVQTYWQSAIALATGIAPGPMGSAHPLNAPYQAFETTDGWITIGAANQANWLRLVEMLGVRHSPRIRASTPVTTASAIRSCWRRRSLPTSSKRASAEWLADASSAPKYRPGRCSTCCRCTPTRRRSRASMVVEAEHSHLGPVKTIGLPVKFSATPGGVRRGAPIYGEHTREVLREHGFTDAEIDRMARAGAIVVADIGAVG